ncbi:enoyl-CoA delta isomerase 2, peroxisomal-like [Pyrus x bretschneideri]|uniref:enoyl-CoA delta isomerase 2, peroxisomal-like n=1 Tax=Pyrus x bretschneideri TaxID=225117 RepID=UPI00202F587E|nr:enoyl-CoA delta isomerase 2, peroxisomal-like [Pyrus x bretschneideri]
MALTSPEPRLLPHEARQRRVVHGGVPVENRLGIGSEGRDAKGMKVKGDEAVNMGIVESAHESAESTVEATMRLGEDLGKRRWNGDIYAEIRKSLYPELSGVLGVAIATPKAKL